MTLFAVTGHPVLHSRSPFVFQRLFATRGVDACYTRLAAPVAASALSLARRIGVAGLNVTAPFKEEIFRLVAQHDPPSVRLQAANTVRLTAAGGEAAFNTDPDGVRFALARGAVAPRGQSVVVLGAGGAAAAAAAALVTAGARVILANRTVSRARGVACRIGCEIAGLDELPGLFARADGVVSCLTAGVEVVDEGWLRPGLWVLDANYARSPLAAAARRRGATVLDGLDWLAGQAAETYRIFAAPAGGADSRGAWGAPGVSAVAEDAVTDPRAVQSLDAASDADVLAEEIARLLTDAMPEGGPTGVAMAGMMGSGKSTVGARLAARLGCPFVDTDQVVAERAGHDIPWLFAHEGEEAFRRLEADTVRRVAGGGRQVVALGGGSLMDPETARLVRSTHRVVWLWASPPCLARRTGPKGTGRPLLGIPGSSPGPAPAGGAGVTAVEARLAAILSARAPVYARASDLVVDGERTVEDIVDLIAYEIGRLSSEP